jgi:G:T-mismatch repair DNA endonuclease (very short patch repair protein)
VHGDKYQYPDQPYVGNKVKVTISCPTHGVFQQKPNSHLSGRGCPQCANKRKQAWNTEVSALVKEGLFSRLAGVNARWGYDIDSFQGMLKPMHCQCSAHGPFTARPNNLLRNSGCAPCGAEKHSSATQSRRLTLQDVEPRGRAVYGDLFDYRAVEHGPNGAVVVGVCNKHGLEWQQVASDLERFNPCGRCSRHQSKGEAAVAALLAAHTLVEARNRTMLRPKELDIYMPEHNLAVEYCGEFWHSHKDAADERANKLRHYQKYADCKALGVRLITLYESEWVDHNYAVRRLLRNALGKGKGKLMARKCDLQKVSAPVAAAFYNKYHPQGGAGGGEHYGLFWKGKLVACMRFALGANDRGAAAAARAWTLTRFATRVTVAGGASRLFKAFVAEHDPPQVKSFSDNRFFEGGMYAQLGFVLEAETEPDYQVWHPKLGLRPKPHYQRRLLPARIAEIGADAAFDPATDPRTEAEMTYLLGAGRIFDCGKKRWLWTNPAVGGINI